jgi:hypothetical protein
MLPYKVAKMYTKGPEQVLANFATSDAAKKFITTQLEEDAVLKVVASYRLYDMGELVETFQQTGSEGSSPQAQNDTTQGQGGNASTQSFRPSPSGLQTTLRPSGMPPSSFKDVKEDDKQK